MKERQTEGGRARARKGETLIRRINSGLDRVSISRLRIAPPSSTEGSGTQTRVVG